MALTFVGLDIFQSVFYLYSLGVLLTISEGIWHFKGLGSSENQGQKVVCLRHSKVQVYAF